MPAANLPMTLQYANTGYMAHTNICVDCTVRCFDCSRSRALRFVTDLACDRLSITALPLAVRDPSSSSGCTAACGPPAENASVCVVRAPIMAVGAEAGRLLDAEPSVYRDRPAAWGKAMFTRTFTYDKQAADAAHLWLTSRVASKFLLYRSKSTTVRWSPSAENRQHKQIVFLLLFSICQSRWCVSPRVVYRCVNLLSLVRHP